MRHVLGRTRKHLMALTAGAVIFQSIGCDPAARTTILAGVESAANSLMAALVAAFFESLEQAADQEQIVRAVTDQLTGLIA